LLAVDDGARPLSENSSVHDRGPHQQVHRHVSTQAQPDASAVAVTNEWVELATGLNRFDAALQVWVPARALWEALPDGHFVAR
jgi:hypothetical protein